MSDYPTQAEHSSALARVRERAMRSNVIWILLALLSVVVVFVAITPSGTFLSVFNAQTIALDSSTLLVLAAATTLVIVSAGLDLSIGSVFTFAAVVGVSLMQDISHSGTQDPWLAIAVGTAAAVLSGLAWGAINGVLIAYFRLPAFVVTLGTLGAALGAARLLAGGSTPSGNTPPELTDDIGFAEIAGVPVPFVVAVAIVLVLGFVLSATRFGERTLMIGSNEEAVRRSGIDVNRHKLKLYMISGGAAGTAAMLEVTRLNVASISTGHTTELIAAIAAVVIGGASLFGGVGQMSGTVVGVFIPVVLANGLLIKGVERFWQDVAIGVILIAAVGFDQWRRERSLAAAAQEVPPTPSRPTGDGNGAAEGDAPGGRVANTLTG